MILVAEEYANRFMSPKKAKSMGKIAVALVSPNPFNPYDGRSPKRRRDSFGQGEGAGGEYESLVVGAKIGIIFQKGVHRADTIANQ